MFKKDGFVLRPPRAEDAELYYKNFDPLDPEVARLTGSKPHFTKEEVVGFFHKCLTDPDRQDFLILSPEGEIIGETVINELDRERSTANFRITLFQPQWFGKGIGTWAVETTRDYAFRELGLEELTLGVYPFNPRAIHVYEKAGFRFTGEVEDGERIMAVRNSQ